MKFLRRDYSLGELASFCGSCLKLGLSPRRIANCLLTLASRTLKLESSRGLPLHLFIETTANCDYGCVKCNRHHPDYRDEGQGRGRRNMPYTMFQKLMDELGDVLVSVRLWHLGEPLLHPDILPMIRYAKDKGPIVALSSNLYRLTGDKAGELARSGLDYLVVSFDGATRESYRFHHRKDGFDRVVANLRNLLSERARLGSRLPFVDLQFIITRHNEHDIPRVRSLAYDLGVDKLSLLRLDEGDVNYSRFPEVTGSEDILPSDERFRLDMEAIRALPFCGIPWEEAVIRFSGLILPCAVDREQVLPAGRLWDERGYRGFGRSWNGPEYRRLRRHAARGGGSMELCNRCAQKDNNCLDQVRLDEAG